MDKANLDAITEKIIGAAHKVSNTLGIGFVEKVYENSHAHEMRKAGLTVVQQHPIKVTYDSVVVGEFFVDVFVNDLVLVELKAVSTLIDDHMIQTLNYLLASGLPACLLINFGTPRAQIRRLHPSPTWRTSQPNKYVKT